MGLPVLWFLGGFCVALVVVALLDMQRSVVRVGDHLRLYGRRVRIVKIEYDGAPEPAATLTVSRRERA